MAAGKTDIFDRQKKTCLSQADLSKKGSIDDGIFDLVKYINNQRDYFTTSSCSGRISIFSASKEENDGRKKNCQWLYVSHENGNEKQVVEALHHCTGNGVFKFEAFVLHTQCRCLQDAQFMLKAALESGFRNSGIIVGKKGRIMLAVRSTHGLEVPLVYNGTLLVNIKYLGYLVSIANDKLRENERRIERFHTNLKSVLNEVARKREMTTDDADTPSSQPSANALGRQRPEKKCSCNCSEQESGLPVVELPTHSEQGSGQELENNEEFNAEDFMDCLSSFYPDIT